MVDVKLPTLAVEPFDPWTDTIVIEGTKYSGCLFRELGLNIVTSVGHILRIEKRADDGVITVRRLHELETEL